MSKYRAYYDGNIDVELESTLIGEVIHCSIKKWSKAVKEEAKEILEGIHSILDVPYILAFVPNSDEKNKKFVKLMGFEFYALSPSIDVGRGLEEIWVIKKR